MRIENRILTKAMVFGWYGKLEGKRNMKGRKRKTVLYWKQKISERDGTGRTWRSYRKIGKDGRQELRRE